MSGSIKSGMWTPAAHAQAQQRQLDSFYQTNGCVYSAMQMSHTLCMRCRILCSVPQMPSYDVCRLDVGYPIPSPWDSRTPHNIFPAPITFVSAPTAFFLHPLLYDPPTTATWPTPSHPAAASPTRSSTFPSAFPVPRPLQRSSSAPPWCSKWTRRCKTQWWEAPGATWLRSCLQTWRQRTLRYCCGRPQQCRAQPNRRVRH